MLQQKGKAMPYVYFTQEERQRARTTDLAAFLRDRGETIHRSGSEHMWLCSGQKVTLRGNLWFHHYTQTGGDAVEFACFDGSIDAERFAKVRPVSC